MDAVPPGWDYNPSSHSQRLPLAILALAGCCIATYLGLFQLNVIAYVWDPLFGAASSRAVLKSRFSQSLPVPDALAGAFAYFCEFILELIGGEDRWRRRPLVVLVFGCLACAMAVGSIALALMQSVVVGSWCLLCLLSAAISVVIVGPVWDEVLATLQHLFRLLDELSLLDLLFVRFRLSDKIGGEAAADPRTLRSGTRLREAKRAIVAGLASIAAGAWLVAAAAALNYAGRLRIDDGVVGPLVAALGIISIADVFRWLRWVRLCLGVWLLIAPWVLGASGAALLNNMAVGAAIIVLALVQGRKERPLGGGWLALVYPERAAR